MREKSFEILSSDLDLGESFFPSLGKRKLTGCRVETKRERESRRKLSQRPNTKVVEEMRRGSTYLFPPWKKEAGAFLHSLGSDILPTSLRVWQLLVEGAHLWQKMHTACLFFFFFLLREEEVLFWDLTSTILYFFPSSSFFSSLFDLLNYFSGPAYSFWENKSRQARPCCIFPQLVWQKR